MTDRVAVSVAELVGKSSSRSWISRAIDVGVRAVELWLPWHVSPGNAASLGRELVRAGIDVACISSPSYLHGDTDGVGGALIDSSIRVASELGAPIVNTYFGHGGDGNDKAAAHRYAEMIEQHLHLAAELGVTIALENEFDAFGHDPEHFDISRRADSLLYLLEGVDRRNFGLNLDPANFYCAGQDVAQAVDLLAPFTVYAHVKDVIELQPDGVPDPRWNLYRDGHRVFQTTRLGDGDVGWSDILERLMYGGFCGTFTLEPHCQSKYLLAELPYSRHFLESRIDSV